MAVKLFKIISILVLLVGFLTGAEAQRRPSLDSLLSKADDPSRLPESVILLLSERVSRYEDPDDQAWIHDRISWAYRETGVFDSAAAHAWHVLRLAPDNKALCSRAYQTLGLVAFRKEAVERAEDFYGRALNLSVQLQDSPGILTACKQLGYIQSRLGRYTEAIDQYQRALNLVAQLGDTITRNQLVFDMAKTYRDMHAFPKAEEFLLRSLKSSGKDSAKRSLVYRELGRLEEEKQNLRKAIPNYMLAVNLDRKQGAPLAEYQALVRIYTQLNVLDTAARYADSAEVAALKTGDAATLRDCFQLRYKLAEKSKDTAAAYVYHVRYRQYDDSVKEREANRRVQHVRDELILGASEASVRTADLQAKLNESREAFERQKYYLFSIAGGAAMLVLLFVFLWYRTRVSMDEMRRESQEKVNALEARNEKLFTVVAHDLQAPVATFSNLARSIAPQLAQATTEERIELLRQLASVTTEVRHSLNELLDWAVAHSGTVPFRPETFSCRQLATSIEEDLRPIAEEHVVTLSFLIPEAQTAYGDRSMIRVVLRTLVYHALRCSPEGQIVTVFFGRKEQLVAIGVKDHGTALSAEKRRQLLNGHPVAGDERDKGIGLSMCRSLIRRNGGDLFVESGPNEGNTIYLTLPEQPV